MRRALHSERRDRSFSFSTSRHGWKLPPGTNPTGCGGPPRATTCWRSPIDPGAGAGVRGTSPP
eukprot:2699092-Alexandrium_andersonii.AAC.1